MLTFINWCQNSAWAQFIRSGKWQYPSVEIVHLVGLVLVFGSILVLNLRIFGRVLKSASVSDVAHAVGGVTVIGLCLQVLSGPLLFITSAMKFYQSGPFWTKIVLLIAALAYHYYFQRPLALADNATSARLRVSAAISMFLWIGVVLAGMGIELLA